MTRHPDCRLPTLHPGTRRPAAHGLTAPAGLRGAAVALALLALAPVDVTTRVALAQAWPDRPIRLVVPFPPGGINDLIARVSGQRLSEQLQQPVVIDNRAGAGGTLGLGIAARANPDGYTLAFGATSTVAVSPALYRDLPYDPLRAFAPIAGLATVPSVVLVHTGVPAASMKELVALARSRPGSLNYASAGAGTSQHMGTELLKTLARIDLVHVPYKGGAAAIADLIGGQVQVQIEPLPTALPHVRSGKVRALAVTSPVRLAVLPELPTVAEAAGLPGYDLTIWFGLLAPAGTPPAVVRRLADEVGRLLAAPEVRERLAQQGAEPMARQSPEQFGAFIEREIRRWAEVARRAGARVD